MQGSSQPVTQSTPPIDAVITWVNGNAPEHRRQRATYAAQSVETLHENAINPHRWSDHDEIRYCLQSIANHAPWLRRLWIVTDGEAPDISGLPADLYPKITLVAHAQIFEGFEHALPTFNSLAIESLLWRIEGLSEQFLYFNDDVFLTAPLSPSDVFQNGKPVLRGAWRDYSALEADPLARQDPAQFNHFMQLNAARLLGFDVQHVFAAAHVVHPFTRSIMAQLFDEYPAQFEAALAFRFRDLSQFLPQGLHNHACLKADHAVIHPGADYLHVHSGQGRDTDPAAFRATLEAAMQAGPKFLCVNDLPQLEQVFPQARAWIARAISAD